MAVSVLARPTASPQQLQRELRYAPTSIDAVCLSLAVGIAALLVAFHMSARAEGGSWYFGVFWVGQVVVVGTVLWAGTRVQPTARLAQGLLAAYAVFNYLPKLLLSPWRALYFDEFGHWQQAQAIVATHNPRPPNTYQPILRDFPGLEWSTVAVHYVTRLSVWHSGQLIIAVAHIVALLAVFGIARGFRLDTRAGFIAAMIYSFNPSFQFFDSQYAYESLGLPLALVTIYCLIKVRSARSRSASLRWCALTLIASASTTLTHHLSTFFAGLVCAAISVLGLPEPPLERDVVLQRFTRNAALAVTATEALLVSLWLWLFARSIGVYLGPHFLPAFSQLRYELTGGHRQTTTGGVVVTTTQSRAAFAGSLSPRYEEIMGYLAPMILLAVVGVAIHLMWRMGRMERAWITPISLAVVFFASIPFALTLAGSEGAHRSWAYSYLGVSVIGAIGARELFALRRAGWDGRGVRALRWAGLVAMVIILIGQATVGVTVYFRFPGPYKFGTDTRGVTAQTRHVAEWLNTNVPTGSHIVTDRFTGETITGYTHDFVPTPNEAQAFGVFRFGAYTDSHTLLREYLAANHFTYFVLDTHIENELPPGIFFPGWAGWSQSIGPADLHALGTTRFATLIHTDGPYQVFRIYP
jgi:hypothetical protein